MFIGPLIIRWLLLSESIVNFIYHAIFILLAFVIANKKLEQLCLVHETIRIKSGVWDDTGIFVYSTLNHIKYALPQGY